VVEFHQPLLGDAELLDPLSPHRPRAAARDDLLEAETGGVHGRDACDRRVAALDDFERVGVDEVEVEGVVFGVPVLAHDDPGPFAGAGDERVEHVWVVFL